MRTVKHLLVPKHILPGCW